MALLSTKLPAAVEVPRQFKDFHPSLWSDYFIIHPPMSSSELEPLKLQEDELKEEVRCMIKSATDTIQSLEIIDRIQRLGVAYHFEDEIDSELERIYKGGFDSNDLYEVALHFRLLRQHRYYISCDVFERFLNEGEFMVSSISKDVNTLLCLYEAAHLYMPQEEILDKAQQLTKGLLIKLCSSNLEPHIAMMVTSALEFPLVRRVDRPRTKLYLSIYEKDDTFNKVLLKFAKLDFIILLALHLDELRGLCLWQKDLRFDEILSFSRDRMVEGYFWTLTAYHEPCYARARMMEVKIFTLLSYIDDMYDTYGTLEELELFTDVINRWELGSINKLPNYMQQLFRVLYQLIEEFEEILAQANFSFRLKYVKEEIMLKKLTKAYLQETKWANESYVPKFKEHLSVSLVTAAHTYLFCAAYIGMENVITEDCFQWLCNVPPLLIASNSIVRLMNDITSDETEQHKNQVISAVQCYTIEHRCSKEEACQKLREMVDVCWKIINREVLFSKDIPIDLLKPIVNMTNFLGFVYKDGDHYTDSKLAMKDLITFVFVEPVHIE